MAESPELASPTHLSATAPARQPPGRDVDLVHEEVVEGGITRYVAVYQSNLPTLAGPVRSVRPMDPSIAGPLHGSFAAHRAPPPPQFAFPAGGAQPMAPAEGTPAAGLDLPLTGVSHPRWTWDAVSGRWLRYEGAAPAVTTDAGQLTATNVVVLRVDVVPTAARDPAGNPVPNTLLSGTGAALVASGGPALAATWTKGAVSAPVVLTDAHGGPVTLAPGNTWIELVPNGTGAVAVG